MKNQNRITAPLELLNDAGEIIEAGYATELFWKYDRKKIKASLLRIKEWDYYYILNEDYGITLTISDLGYASLLAICFIDFKNKFFSQHDAIKLLTLHKSNFPNNSSKGITSFDSKKFSINIEVSNNIRKIKFRATDFKFQNKKVNIAGEFKLEQDPAMDTMVIATPWKEKPTAFYYNQKINCMEAKGELIIGNNKYTFEKQNSFAGLDWGRGNWTYINRWYWSSASGILNGNSFGWNLGYGFSDRTSASENMIFYNKKAHKLQDVKFHIDTSDYTKPWKFSSSDGRFEMDFSPIIDRNSKINILLIKSVQHQVFGYFNGYVILDDGSKLEVKNFLGFAEDVYNRY